MNRNLILIGIAAVIGTLTFVYAQSSQPGTGAEQLEQTAKDFNMTPAQLDAFVRRELGDPVIIDGDMIVGVRRDATGHVTAVQISTPKREVTFNRAPDEKHSGLRYSRSDLTDTPNISSADDIDGDGRIDQIILTAPDQTLPHILLRIGATFTQVKPTGDGHFQTAEGGIVTFNFTQHEWMEGK